MEEIKVNILKKNDAKKPLYMTEGASGMDIFAAIKEDITLKPMERKLIPSGICVEIPYGYELQIRPRSGLALKHGITMVNAPGTIDSDYRGEIGIIMINLGESEFKIVPNERIGQLILQKVYKVKWREVKELSLSSRGKRGFGHTGRE